MSRILKFTALDFRVVAPFLTWKNVALFVILAVFNIYNLGVSAIPFMFSIFLILFGSYTFAVSDTSATDAMYVLLGIDRSTVVFGRYLSAVLADLIGMLLAFLLSIAAGSVFSIGYDLKEVALVCLFAFFLATSVQFLQFSVLFALGYQRGRMLSMIPAYLVFGLCFGAFKMALDNPALVGAAARILSSPYLVAAIAAAVWLLLLLVTSLISRKKYRLRDF